MPTPPLKTAIETALAQVGVSPSGHQVDQLATLVSLLQKWSKRLNLTAIKDTPGIIRLHLADSLTIHELIHGQQVIDVGTGGGFPGLPLAIMQPEVEFELLDASERKLRFVQQAALELGLRNVRICHARVPDYAPGAAFDTVTARAFASLTKIIEDCGHLLAPGGRIVAMKSRAANDEIGEISTDWHIRTVNLQAPDDNLERIAVIAEPADPTKSSGL